MQQSDCVCVAGSKCLLIIGEHSNVVDTLGFQILDLLNKSWDVAGTAHRRVCSWNTDNNGLQRVTPAYSCSVSALSATPGACQSMLLL